jgi:metallophosphoesterase (TIGR03767 family)
MPKLSRRTVLLAGAGSLALLTLGATPETIRTARITDAALRTTADRAIRMTGTTLEQVAAPSGSTGPAVTSSTAGYRRLSASPGYPLVVRTDLAAARSGRDSTRTALASIVQFTDLHIVDAQSTMRFEYFVETDSSAFRPHEALGTHGASQLVARVNQLGAGPFSGRPFDALVCTGDNSDNNETVELEWFLTVMNGGTITANTGAAEWEGVQNSGNPLFYNPESKARDRYKDVGFPQLDDFFSMVTTPHTSEGLKTPWYSVYGNHDDSIGGTIPSSWGALEQIYTGSKKFTTFASEAANKAILSAFSREHPVGVGESVKLGQQWTVTPDERRKPFTPNDFIAAHLETEATGPGPIGHGFDSASLESSIAYYSFSIAPGVTGISLDSTNRAGFTYGSLGDAQFRWLEATLRAGSRRYYDATGAATTHSVDDELFVIFSHHPSGSMTNGLPSPDRPTEARHLGPEVVSLLQRFPNVVAWVNGHTHSNNITPRPGPTPARSFWEINTASHIEFPQQARIVDVCDNKDGTLSLFTTLIESAAPVRGSYSDGSQASLASLYREFSLNDLYYTASHEGQPEDHNTELLLKNPLA